MPITRRKRANPPEENNNHLESSADSLTTEQAPATPDEGDQTGTPDEGTPRNAMSASLDNALPAPFPSIASSPAPVTNGDQGERQDYTPSIEGGRRTSRGELFQRPPQPPLMQPPVTFTPSAPLQAPSHEIALPLGNLLHLAYNPGYTGSNEARSLLLQQLASESKAGGRARCWNCGSIAIVYDRWNTRSKTFGEVGIAFCEICGVWSVM